MIRELAQRVSQHEDELMTLAQQLEQIGRKQGLEQGIEQGLAQGRRPGEQEASMKIAPNLLKKGMDMASVVEMTGLSEEDLKQINH
ncbi:hypothetical protein [Candidatus Pantoea deserta]|uniref:hypothetical protein n=1 Tax=Candidatus Pantoea deserta TaxID=1869313 RepID=UPI001F3F7AB0|nr:hypothetical protein [Pantoea deserta]